MRRIRKHGIVRDRGISTRQEHHDDKRTDLLGQVPADNGAGTFLSPAPNDKCPDLLEHARLRRTRASLSANGAPHTSLGQRPRFTEPPIPEAL
jgi:hypothetical protein